MSKDGFGRDGRWVRHYRKSEDHFEAAAGADELNAFVIREFPLLANMVRGPNRRRVLQLMGASFSLAGLAGCGNPERHNTQMKIIPYVHQPPRIIPAMNLSYASSSLLDGIANGIVVTTVDGRPIKVEGNPQHPWSLGGTDMFTQASILGLYDPERSEAPLDLGRSSGWPAFQTAIQPVMAKVRQAKGQGFRLLTGPVSSRALLDQIGALQKTLPSMQWHVHAPLGDAGYEGARLAFGRPLETRWHFDKAKVIVALDGDFLDPGPQQIGVAMRWSEARRKAAAAGQVLAMHDAGPTATLTLAKADYPLVAGQQEIGMLLEGLTADVQAGKPAPMPPPGDAQGRWRVKAAEALLAARGQGIVMAGAHQPPEVQAAVHRLNQMLGNTGQTVFHTAPVVGQASSLDALAQDMHAGKVSHLVMLDTNPAYTAPADLHFAEALQRVSFKIHAGLYVDETAARCHWHLPVAHPLERWGDARAYDGTVSLLQPMVEPLYQGRSPEEILSILADAKPRDGLAIIRSYWKANWPKSAQGGGFAAGWQQALTAGFIAGTALPPETVGTAPALPAAAPAIKPGYDVLIRPDPTIRDGSFATIGWLQELPKPMTKVVWDNIIAVSGELAEKEQLKNGDFVTLRSGALSVTGPVWITAAQHAKTITLYLGYGRQMPGAISDGLGYDAYRMRSVGGLWRLTNVTLSKTGEAKDIASTQHIFDMDGHDFAKAQSPGSKSYPDASAEPSMFPAWPTDGYAWGMVIDLDTCIGCNACIVACQAENNIPVVGYEQVLRGRDMHWLRVDRYTEGTAEVPDTRFMPVPCMMCEKAPCELACPVEASIHDMEGLNVQVYNRCVGTRACEAYCPYKVRRFNFADYGLEAAPSRQLQYNPQVSVRGRGVMEKCTYCVQRIETAHIAAGKENRPIRDGEVQTACQGACPTRAITFGDMQDPKTVVSRTKALPRNYTLLEELNTRPRTTYLAALRPADALVEPGATEPLKS